MKIFPIIIVFSLVVFLGCGESEPSATGAKQATSKPTQETLIIVEELKLKGESGGISLDDILIHTRAYIGTMSEAEQKVAKMALDLFAKQGMDEMFLYMAKYVTTDKGQWNDLHQTVIDQYEDRAIKAIAEKAKAAAAREEERKQREIEREKERKERELKLAQREAEREAERKIRPYKNAIQNSKRSLKHPDQSFIDAYFDTIGNIKTQAIKRHAYSIWRRQGSTMHVFDHRVRQKNNELMNKQLEEIKSLEADQRGKAIEELIKPYMEKATEESSNWRF